MLVASYASRVFLLSSAEGSIPRQSRTIRLKPLSG